MLVGDYSNGALFRPLDDERAYVRKQDSCNDNLGRKTKGNPDD